MTPLARSLAKLREEGWIADKVEQPWNPHIKRTRDLFGFGDILAFKGETVLIVQATSGGEVQRRMDKIKAEPRAKAWAGAVHRMIVVHGWRKVGARGKRKLWECRELYHYF